MSADIRGDQYIGMGCRVGPRHWFQPHVSVTHRGQVGEDYFDGAPFLAVEIVSQSNTAEQIEAKIEDYHTHGAAEVWIL